jgi:hypothetical protein
MTTAWSKNPLRHLRYSGDNVKTLHMLSQCCRWRCQSVLNCLWLNDSWNPQFRGALLLISFTEVVSCILHQQNVNRSGSHTQTSQILRSTSPVLPSDSRCSQAPLDLSKVLSDSERAFSGAPESTCSYGGAFKMLRDLTFRIVIFWSS